MTSSIQSEAEPVPAPERILCVLGMHRSGTSCLTGSLEEAGLFLGDRHTWNPHNLKGNRENQQIVDINDRVLGAVDSAWDNPPSGRVAWPQDELAAARVLFAAYAQHSPFGFKDPRTLLVLSGWQCLFPHMQYVGIFRHPLAVAGSLHKRSGMPLAQGLNLWFAYNRRLLQEYRRAPLPILCFDDEQSLFQEKLQGVLASLGFDSSEWRGEFYDEGLRSAQLNAADQLPWHIRRLYRKLQRLAV
ncbi:hypothetical protein [Pseudohalioglobus lutimaris]|nr:hypothetical protein [Pseudohalioglobus lutimaris]